MFEIVKALSFILSILSLYPIIVSAFFVPGVRWEERLWMALFRVALACCVCFSSGLFFLESSTAGQALTDRLIQTLPVRMFFWTLAGVAVLFLVSWYIEEYFVPLMWRNQPREIGVLVVLLGQ